jgi:MoaA/NifB/PqqE/SkfB family radical SAM enzyme
MFKLSEVRSVHFEITSKCQASCPMCPRRINGGILNPLISLNEVSLSQFKEWFSIEFIQQLKDFNMCGNLGDPIIAKDTLEIFKYLRLHNPGITLIMHTNGSARSVLWWQSLAIARVQVTFGIDGTADTHSLYRIGTDYHQILYNAGIFIQAGGKAEWHMLVFKHNEHEVSVCQSTSEELGFAKFSAKNTSRFKDNKFHVLDEAGKTTHVLHPTTKSINMTSRVKSAIIDIKPVIQCKAQRTTQIYISAAGIVSPCCWLDVSWFLPMQESRIDYMDTIGRFPNLNSSTLSDIFESGFFDSIAETWPSAPLRECTKQCGSFDKLQEQFSV